jgi:hypothetical protein
MLNKPYSRKVGSQSEQPDLKIEQNLGHITGYHEFKVNQNDVTLKKATTKRKEKTVWLLLKNYKSQDIIDIGCSNGAIGLKSVSRGCVSFNFLDHDDECINLLQEIKQTFFFANNIKIHKSSVGKYRGQHEVGLALALIHWIYSFSERSGTLNDAIKILKNIAQDTLIIEWVDITDSAILEHDHITKNGGDFEQYNRTNFINGLQENYNYTQLIAPISGTREIWIASDFPIKVNFVQKIFMIKWQWSRKITAMLRSFK